MYILYVVNTDGSEWKWLSGNNRRQLRRDGVDLMDLIEAYPTLFCTTSHVVMRNREGTELEWFDLSHLQEYDRLRSGS